MLLRSIKEACLLTDGPLLCRGGWPAHLWHMHSCSLQQAPQAAQGIQSTHVHQPQVSAAKLDDFLKWNISSPPVPGLPGQSLPTALSWLRRRGLPGVPVGLLYKAFRQRQVRVFNGSKVTRASKHQVLAPGHLLLIPKDLQQQYQDYVAALPSHLKPATQRSTSPAPSQHTSPPASTPAPAPPLPDASSVPYYMGQGCDAPGLVNADHLPASALKKWTLQVHKHITFINKPAGVRVQGPGSSIASMMHESFNLKPGDELRLVHRLDRLVSGVLAIGRTPDAASWLSEGFVNKAKQEGGDAAEQGSDSGGVRIKRTYLALLAGHIEGQQEGKLRLPVLVEDRFRPAVTRFKIRGTSPRGITLVELEPITGRKHQLRIHCAKLLGAPIIGDVKYGYQGVEPHRKLSELLPEAWWQSFSPATADLAAKMGSRKERRRSAAARYAAQRGGRAAADMTGTDIDTDGSDARQAEHEARREGSDDDEGALWGADEGDEMRTVSRDLPIFLHARSMVVHTPGHPPIRVKAPLPPYMADVVAAMGWPLPPDSATSHHFRDRHRRPAL